MCLRHTYSNSLTWSRAHGCKKHNRKLAVYQLASILRCTQGCAGSMLFFIETKDTLISSMWYWMMGPQRNMSTDVKTCVVSLIWSCMIWRAASNLSSRTDLCLSIASDEGKNTETEKTTSACFNFEFLPFLLRQVNKPCLLPSQTKNMAEGLEKINKSASDPAGWFTTESTHRHVESWGAHALSQRKDVPRFKTLRWFIHTTEILGSDWSKSCGGN